MPPKKPQESPPNSNEVFLTHRLYKFISATLFYLTSKSVMHI